MIIDTIKIVFEAIGKFFDWKKKEEDNAPYKERIESIKNSLKAQKEAQARHREEQRKMEVNINERKDLEDEW